VVKRFFDILLGRSQPIAPKMEKLFALTTAYITLTTELGLEPGDRSGICFKPLASAAFEGLRPELQRLLEISAREAGTKVEAHTDPYGYQWAVLADPQFEDLIATTHVFSQTLQEEGFGEQLLAAVFKFVRDGRPVYWIYNYKRGNFYPFVPQHSEGRKRDNAYELRLRATMQREMPIEPNVEYWYPLWGVPV
jgi:hypothetical protein